MGLLAPPSPASTLVHQSSVPAGTASLSEDHSNRSARGPTRESVNRQATSRPLADFKNDRVMPQSSNRLVNELVNGDTEHVALIGSYDKSFKPQNVSRARTENHRALAHRPKALMTRSKSNYEPRNIPTTTETNMEEHGELRHGWEEEYNSKDFLGHLNSVCFEIPCRATVDVVLG